MPLRFRPLGKTGLSVSEIGFGAAPLGNEFGEIKPEEGVRAVHLAIDLGINFFDTSPYYGRTLSEERLGKALAGKRHQVILATKCGRYDSDEFDFTAQRVKTSLEESLRRLQTDFIDLFQVHDIEWADAKILAEETIPALRALQSEGRVRFIGITGLQLQHLKNVAELSPVDTILSYCRYNLLGDDLDTVLAPLAREHGIGLINASPLHMGALTEKGAPAWHPAPGAVHAAARNAARLCRARGADLSRVALQYCLDYPEAATTLSGLASAAQVRANVEAACTERDPELTREVLEMLNPARNATWATGLHGNHDSRPLY